MDLQKQILKFWRDVEIFNLPDLPDDIGYLVHGSTLPWTEIQEPLEDAKRRYVLFFGKQSKPHIIGLMEEFTEDNEEKPDWIEKTSGNTCMAVLILEEDGQLVEDGAYLQASYLHGLQCLKEKKNMDTILTKLEQVQEAFRERYNSNPFSVESDHPLKRGAITWNDLKKEITILNQNSIAELKCNNSIYCKKITISKKIKNADTAFLNSFYLEDLNDLIKHKAEWNNGINEYLKPEINETNRIDLLKNPFSFFEAISPAKMQMGKWPSNPNYGAYSAQLGAMATSLETLKEGGIVGINGPPGTGKTTILGDIISEIIVQRAKRLVDANNIVMFMPLKTTIKESGKISYYPLKNNIFEDMGIVVASNNNAAVENITKELPDKRNIASIFQNADYFASQSQELIEGDSWGIICATLGNAENRNLFKSSFWYGTEDKFGFDGYLKAFYGNEEKEDRTLVYLEKFNLAKKEFLQLISEFEKFKATATAFHNKLHNNIKDITERVRLELEQRRLKELASQLSKILSEKSNTHFKLTDERKIILENIQVWERSKPSFFFFQKLFRTKNFKKWNAPYLTYLTAFNLANTKIIENERIQRDVQEKLNSNLESELKLRIKLNPVVERINKYNKEREEIHIEYGITYENLPDHNLYLAFVNDRETFHKSTPWSSLQLNTLRSKIFLKSLEIHKYAVLFNAKQFRTNMYLFFEILDGKAKVDESIVETAWKTLFFLIPVVSTSLASVSRLFRGLRKNSIGYLLIDEAGQATPQSAVGIISRAKRCIIIGDPLQLEPVLTTPHRLIQILNQPYQTGLTWSPRHTSVQQLVDRISLKGTMMQSDHETNIWTGFPLRTHRRCQEPMFSLANNIAYNNQMVMATPSSDFHCKLGQSKWFHVNGTIVEDRHVIREEIEILKEKLAILGRDQEVFVISPFKSVANRCRIELSSSFPKARCGTIHTFQGKESKIVFLILGSDPAKPGARAWASQRPNMLNVALTRAKNFFYVIGNNTSWRKCNYFNILAEKLEEDK